LKAVVPTPSSLPKDRVRDAAAFKVTGVDYAGPLFMKGGEQAWIVLYTCAVYRAVHLELVSSLLTEAFLESFRRFIARRGSPKTIYSDHETNFVGAENAFRKLDWKRIAAVAAMGKIYWIFIPPNAACWGGWCERLIGTLKTILRKVLGKSALDYEEITTILCECEDYVNSCLLTV